MNMVQLYIDEELDTLNLEQVKNQLLSMPHVTDVELNFSNHHDMVVEYEAMGGMPMNIIDNLRQSGLHADIISA
ncbi:MAG: hypothetical protein OEX12_08780 [Gammaproteobacteria bacterium]|nr:hypothetical protein [Gammaproteobacteria bacterium]